MLTRSNRYNLSLANVNGTLDSGPRTLSSFLLLASLMLPPDSQVHTDAGVTPTFLASSVCVSPSLSRPGEFADQGHCSLTYHSNPSFVPMPVRVENIMSSHPAFVASPVRAIHRSSDAGRIHEYESVPSSFRHIVVELESRSFHAFWREPGEPEWRRETPDAAGPIRPPEFGITLALDEVYHGRDFG